jgi:alanyl-tRNA synthetase
MAVPETLISYPEGCLSGAGRVVHVEPWRGRADDGLLIITDQTPFHPVDPRWPDQPGDRGVLRAADLDLDLEISDTLTAAFHGPSGKLLVDTDIAFSAEEPDYVFVVAHHTASPAEPAVRRLPGARVLLEVDRVRRTQLSCAHTACHLVAFAFNKVVDHLWRKDAPRTSLGHRDFDRMALIDTRHQVGGSTDRYRLGKSLQRKGFDRRGLLDDLASLMAATNAQLEAWLATDADVRIDAPSALFSQRRQWACSLPEGTASMPCGGTHVRSLGEISSITVSADYEHDESRLTLGARTEPQPQALQRGVPASGLIGE